MVMDFLIMLLPGFQCEINSITGCGISDIAAGWISLRNKSHSWRWNFQKYYWVDFTGT
jgi:hypothetical protein